MERQLLTLPAVARALYKRNFLRQAVCELRFPTLYALEAPRPPAQLALALRHDYPMQAPVHSVEIGPAGTQRLTAHSFKSRQQDWAVTLRANAVSLETSRYTTFEELRRRLAALLPQVASVIDSDFFTRVGLRYINVVPFPSQQPVPWINLDLCKPVLSGMFGDIAEFNGRVAGPTNVGSYLLQHGVLLDITAGRALPEYSIDIDTAAENVEQVNVLEVVDKLHDHEFSLFSWAIGPAALAHLKSE